MAGHFHWVFQQRGLYCFSDFVFASSSAMLTGAGSKFVKKGYGKLDDILDRSAIRSDRLLRDTGYGKSYSKQVFTRRFEGPTVSTMNGLWDLFKFQFMKQFNNGKDVPKGVVEIGDLIYEKCLTCKVD